MKIKRIPLIAVIVFVSFKITAQDLIYKKNGDVVQAVILEKTNRMCKYREYMPVDSVIYFISLAIVDSIKFQDGKREVYEKSTSDHLLSGSKLSELQSADMNYRHHLTGINMAGLIFYQNLGVSYEFLAGKAKHIGLKVSYAVNLNSKDLYFDEHMSLNNRSDWLGRAGINYYFLPPRTFRLGAGVNVITGSFTNVQYMYDEFGGYTEIKEKKNQSGLTSCIFLYYNLTHFLAINLGLEIPVYAHPKSTAPLLHCELLLNF